MEEFEIQKNEPSFSLNDFKKWMTSQKQVTPEERRKYELAGVRVESKLGLKRLPSKMSTEDGDLLELAREFRRFGGTILESDEDNNVLVEVDSGSFLIPRIFVRKIKD
jgi:hypothetical protein